MKIEVNEEKRSDKLDYVLIILLLITIAVITAVAAVYYLDLVLNTLR